jgi:hypothetical protein
MTTQQAQCILPSNPADRKKIMDKMNEVDAAMNRIAAERDLIKATITDLAQEFQLPKKYLNKFSRDYHKQKFQATLGENEEYSELVAALVPSAFE